MPINFSIPLLITKLIILIVALPVHELAHAYTADWFGDDTPRLYGRLSLNPLAHLDFFGSLMILVSFFGWAKPVPINLYALQRRNQYGPMWVALAGPLSNLGLAVIAAIILRSGIIPNLPPGDLFPSLYQVFDIFIQINLALMLFNLIPVFPLDGEKVLTYLLPPDSRGFLDQIRPYGPIILMGLIFFGGGILGLIIGIPLNYLYSLLLG